MNEDLDYNFQGSGVIGDNTASNPDLGNEAVLTGILKDLKNLKKSYHTVDKLDLNDKNFTIEQQTHNNKWAVQFISSIELLIQERLKELDNGR